MKILGISGLYHDSAATLCDNGLIVAAAQEERFTRVRHDARFPENAMKYCLETANVLPDFLDAVVYYDNPFLTYQRFLHNIASLGDDCEAVLSRDFDALFGAKLWVHKLAQNVLGMFCANGKLLVTKHHYAHAASAFYPSPFENAAIITADGVGEWATTTIGYGCGNKIELLKHINYPHSLGLLYSAFTYFCGFKVNSGEYKLMGLAPYGRPIYADRIRETLIDIKEDGSYRLNMDYLGYYSGPNMTNKKFADLFDGVARKPETDITKREMDLAASIQLVTEEVMIKLAKTAKSVTGSNNLVMAGGIALNCVANGKIIREGIFDKVWIQPAAGDAGGALGSALYAYYAHFGNERKVGRRDSQKGSLLGCAYSTSDILKYLDKQKAKYTVYDSKTELYKQTAILLDEGKVLGFFNGRMEYGPRALGARSIFGDPRNPDMQAKLNLKIKFRESFRPFAPAVLAEKAAEYFDFAGESPYMLACADVKESHRKHFSLKEFQEAGNADMLPIVRSVRSDIPAVTHVDYSARLQTVHQDDNADFHALLSEFYQLTGCPVLVNTSFNVRGEPIVRTPEDAYRCFMRTEMDALVLENVLLYKEGQPHFEDGEDWRNSYALD
jgi:carbamoyltransferase